MIDYEMLYQFCKNYVEQYEICEEEYDEYLDCLDNDCDNYETDFSSCEVYKAGLQALIVDDFVQSLNPKLQSQIIMDCMKQKTNNNFRKF